MITSLGVAVFFISIVFLIWGIVQRFRGVTVPGWSSVIVSIWAIGGLILLALGVLGEYIGRIYLETKGRPRFLIDEYLS
jgi:glycosyltransferase involved in cell wall biosynthesis